MPPPLGLLSYLPRPPAVQGEGVCKLLNGELLAYSAGSAIVVIDVSILFYSHS